MHRLDDGGLLLARHGDALFLVSISADAPLPLPMTLISTGLVRGDGPLLFLLVGIKLSATGMAAPEALVAMTREGHSLGWPIVSKPGDASLAAMVSEHPHRVLAHHIEDERMLVVDLQIWCHRLAPAALQSPPK